MRQNRSVQLESLQRRKAEFIEPMDCAPVSKLPDGSRWLFEIKLDGYRAVAVKSDRAVNLFPRRHKSFNTQYPYLVDALTELPKGTVVDGEIVALDESGRPNFNLLQEARYKRFRKSSPRYEQVLSQCAGFQQRFSELFNIFQPFPNSSTRTAVDTNTLAMHE